MTTTMTGHPHLSSAASATLATTGTRPHRRRPHTAAADTARTGTGTPATTGTGRPHAAFAEAEARPHPHTGSAALDASGARPWRRRPHGAVRTGSAAAVAVTGRPSGAGVRPRSCPLVGAVLTTPSPRPAPEHWL
ncbi:hypothetical protein [Streptomyces flaveolus]|uniref:hypothetical protein n=1 Tax=Streptomyces flaveolus TaxID=67297 RepID=UPI0036A0BE45